VTTDATVTIHMVCSLDGYIVKKDGDVSWLDTSDRYEKGIEAEDSEAALEAIDCWVIGSRTYEHALALGWPYGDKPTFVLTHRDLSSDRESVHFRSGDLERFVNDELKAKHRSIWLCGGAEVTREFLRLGLADALCVAIAPILIGDGVPFFDSVGVEVPLHLEDAKAYRSGVVELWYRVREG